MAWGVLHVSFTTNDWSTNMKKMPLLTSIVLLTLGAAGTANATIHTVFDSWDVGLANFNQAVSDAGATATHDNWASFAFTPGNLALVRTDYTVTQTDGSALSLISSARSDIA